VASYAFLKRFKRMNWDKSEGWIILEKMLRLRSVGYFVGLNGGEIVGSD
jgi:hypothetical protein